MNEIIKQEIKELFFENKGYATTKEISDKGIFEFWDYDKKQWGKHKNNIEK